MNFTEALEIYKRKEIPEDVEIHDLFDFNYRSGDLQRATEFRYECIDLLGFVAVTKKLCRALAKFIGDRKVLEVCCGLGALAKGLRDEGVDIIATDNFGFGRYTSEIYTESFHNSIDKAEAIARYDQKGKLWLDDVENIDAVEAVKKYGKDRDIILLSWSPHEETLDVEILKAMREVNPNALLLCITEGEGGCIGSEQLYREADEIEEAGEAFDLCNEVFRRHMGMHDHLELFR